jgi:hypothetical protein
MASYTVERSATIKAPADRIRDLVEDFHRWTEWSPWEDLDPDLERTYSGPDRGPGAHYAWKGNRKAGAGSMEITGVDGSGVDVALAFLKPFKSESRLRFTFTQAGDATQVDWRMDGETTGMAAAMTRFMSFDKMVGPDFEKGLTRLKAAAEA